MIDPTNYVIRCADSQWIVADLDELMPQLVRDVRRRLNLITMCYLSKYGKDGLWARVNGKTIASVLDEFHEADALTEIDSGQVGDVKYVLYDKPKENHETA
jgi:hypothetical protein